MCDCKYPLASRIGDVVQNPKPDREGLVIVTRYCDCLLCGPSVKRMKVCPTYQDGQLVTHHFVQPFHLATDEVRR